MKIIEIQPLENGAHRNQMGGNICPEGWAIIPESIEIPDTFPFVSIEVEDGIVTNMISGQMPEPEEPIKENNVYDDLASALKEGVNSI